jgi:hypothetical protein
MFFLLERPIGRINYGCYSRIPQRERFNPSLPIMPISPNFQRLARDPRNIGHNLAKLHFTAFLHQIWQGCLKKWDISATRTEYKYLLAFASPRDYAIYDRASATGWLQKEDEEWRNELMRKGPKVRKKYKLKAKLENSMKPAFGF